MCERHRNCGAKIGNFSYYTKFTRTFVLRKSHTYQKYAMVYPSLPLSDIMARNASLKPRSFIICSRVICMR